MKHPVKLTLMLVCLFIIAQVMGLIILKEYINIKASAATGTTVVNTEAFERSGFEPPQITNESLSFLLVLGSVFVGTFIILMMIKFKKGNLWKVWYFLAILSALAVALNPFVFKLLLLLGLSAVSPYIVTIVLAVVLDIFKVIKPNIYVHNITEMLIYGGIAALLVPIINMISATILLVLISIYDAYAVWKSKHMVKMAEFQKDTKLFAGLSIPYPTKTGTKTKTVTATASKKASKVMATKVAKNVTKKSEATPLKNTQVISTTSSGSTAILGGGDIAFPLLFSGVVMKTTGSYLFPLIITFTAAAALYMLFWRAEKGKFYPAMPFISAGCFLGYAICWLIGICFGKVF